MATAVPPRYAAALASLAPLRVLRLGARDVLASDAPSHAPLAIKCLPLGDRDSVARALVRRLRASRVPTLIGSRRVRQREVRLSRLLGAHENVVRALGVRLAGDALLAGTAFLLLARWDADLSRALAAGALTARHAPLVAYGVLRALLFVHSAGVVRNIARISFVARLRLLTLLACVFWLGLVAWSCCLFVCSGIVM